MPKQEKRFLEWLEAHLPLIAGVLVTVLGIWARVALRGYESLDYTQYLLPWYEKIKADGGLAGLANQVGDYNMPYQFLIACLTLLPSLPALYAYKVLSALFDVLLAGAVAWLVWHVSTGGREQRALRAVAAYAAVFCSPVVVFNSAAWAQCDSIYSFFAVAALAAVIAREQRPLPAFLLLGAAFACKLQAAFLLPFFLLLYVARKSFSALYFAAVPGMMVLLSLPNILAGRSVLDVFGLYGEQIEGSYTLFANYPSFWALFGAFDVTKEGRYIGAFYPLCFAVCLTVLGIGCWLLLRSKQWLTPDGILYTAFLCTYTCVLFLPSMHERYGYLYEVLAVAVAVLRPRTAKYALCLTALSMLTYGSFLQSGVSVMERIGIQWLAVANVAVWVAFVTDYVRALRAAQM